MKMESCFGGGRVSNGVEVWGADGITWRFIAPWMTPRIGGKDAEHFSNAASSSSLFATSQPITSTVAPVACKADMSSAAPRALEPDRERRIKCVAPQVDTICFAKAAPIPVSPPTMR